MADAHQRTFYHLNTEILLDPGTAEDVSFTMVEVIDRLLKQRKRKKFTFDDTSDAAGVRLDQWKRMAGGVVLLFSYADDRFANPSRRNKEDDKIIPVKQLKGHVWASAAHLTVSYAQQLDGTYPAILEIARKIGRTKISDFVRHAFARDPDTMEDGSLVYPYLKFTGRPSGRLIEALNQGSFYGVELIRTKGRLDVGLGERGMNVSTELIRVKRPRGGKLRKEFNDQKKIPLLNWLLALGKERGYDTLRVNIDRPKDSKDLPAHIDVDIEEHTDVCEATYFERSTEQFDDRLNEAHPKIIEKMVKYMAEKLDVDTSKPPKDE